MSLSPPEPELRVSVVVPARNEEDLIGRCMRSLGSQTGLSPAEYEVLLVLDRCTDSTRARALEAASEYPELRLALLEGPGLGAGHARRAGMDAACERLISLDRPEGLIASTDADTVAAPDWLYQQLRAAKGGARAIGGRIDLLDESGLSEEVRSWRERRGKARHLELLERQKGRDSAPRVEHWQFSGASMSLTAEAYREVGGMEPRAALEDEQLESALERCNIPIERPLDVRVSTSPRLVGRASRGLARDLSLASWLENNTYPEPPEYPALDPSATVSVIAPADDETASEFSAVPGLAGVEPEIISVPTRSAPLTEEFGPVQGRGDALWRGLSEAAGEIVVLLPDLSPESLTAVPALLAPLLEREGLELVKGYSQEIGASELSRLVGRPLINLHHPELSGLNDPLSEFVAARRALLESLPFPCGAGVDASLPLDAARSRGVSAIAQAALSSQPARASASSEDSYAIIAALMSRLPAGPQAPPSPAPLVIPARGGEGFEVLRVHLEERPPLSATFGESRIDRPSYSLD